MSKTTGSKQHRDSEFMNRAIQLARKGLFTSHPNPRVGCVIVQHDQIIAEGFHCRAGEDHAEIVALKQAGEAARGARCFVSLEPCAHHGKTPPCAEALIKAGVQEVIIAMLDPNPLVAGKGMALLEQAGIKVSLGLCEDQAQGLNPGFIKRMQQGLPFVRCKLAASLDARTAMASGESQWITSDLARKDVQRWRAQSSAVLTGIGTVLADDPSLNVRDAELDLAGRQLTRVILDSQQRFPTRAKMLQLPGETLILTTKHSDRQQGLEWKTIDADQQGQVDLRQAMQYLAECEMNEVLVEAGPSLTAGLIQAGLVDQLIVYIAPKLLGADARPLLQLHGLETLSDALTMEFTSVKLVGADLRIIATLQNKA